MVEETSHTVTEDPWADAAAGKGLGVTLTFSDSLLPIPAGVMIRLGSSLGLPCDWPGPIVYTDPHDFVDS